MRHFGWIKVDERRAVGTSFYHFGGLPLWPSRHSEIVDRSTMQVWMEREWWWRVEKTSYEAVEIPRHRKSMIAGYVRTWGALSVVAAVMGLVSWLVGAPEVACLGVVPFIVGRFFRRWISIRRGEPMMLAGLSMMAGGFVGIFIPLPMLVLGVLAGLAVKATFGFTYKEPPAKPRIARSPLTIPKAVARIQPPAPPVIVPVQAPEHVEPSTDAPRFLT